jgi:hypothetical protein
VGSGSSPLDLLDELQGAQFCGAVAGGNRACWLVLSVTHGAVGAIRTCLHGSPGFPGLSR